MRSIVSHCLAAVVLLAATAGARAGDAPSTDKLNTKIANFTLTDDKGKPISLHDSFKDAKAVVVVFLSFDCPVSKDYSTTLAELHKKFSGQGVAFLAVSSDDLDAAALAKEAAEFKIPFAVLKDNKFVAADSFKAVATPEAFVLDHNFVLRYRGRIDNSYAQRLLKNQKTTRNDLQVALDELLAGKAVSEPATKAVGCPISRDRTAKATGKVTYYKDVAPILQESCQVCHRPKEVGPFSLETYKQAVNWASDIKDYTQSRKMPPWKPTEGPAFHNERKLTDQQIATLAAWVEDGTPEGDPKDAPKPKQFASADGWMLGKPDLVLTMKEDFTLDAAGADVFRVMVFPTGLTEDKFVTAVEVKPGNPRIVHHSLNFFDRTGEPRKLEAKEKDRVKGPDEKDFGPGYTSRMSGGIRNAKAGDFGGLGGWAPGAVPHQLPEGTGWMLPKGADVLIQLHYHRDGKVEKDRTSIGLYFAKKPTKQTFESIIIPGLFLAVPAGDANFKVAGKIVVEDDCTLYSVMHHMHRLGKSAKITVEPPDGKPFTLLAIQDWDYNWQETYWLKEPLAVKKGTKLSVQAIYDNSDKNPNNPFDPPRLVRFGEQTDNEMCFVFLGATKETPGRIKFKVDGLDLRRP